METSFLAMPIVILFDTLGETFLQIMRGSKLWWKKSKLFPELIEHGIIGEGSQISTNQKRENSAFSFLIGQNFRPFLEHTVLY